MHVTNKLKICTQFAHVQFWWAPKFPTLWAPVSEATQVVKDVKQETLAAFVLSAC